MTDPEAAALVAGLDRWLSSTATFGSAARVTSIDQPAAGRSNTTWLVALAGSDRGGRSGDPPLDRLVVRTPPPADVHMGDKLELQVFVQEVLAAHGIPAPSPARFEADERWLGVPFVTMPWVPGHVAGEAVALDPWVAESSPAQQRTLHQSFVDVLAAVHRLDWQAAGLDRRLRGADQTLDDDVAYWAGYLTWATDGRPPGRLAAALDWLGAHRPTTEPPRSLLWGDVRLGNAIFGDDRRVRAAIDWETAWIGPAEADLGYWLVLDALTDELVGSRVAGFPRPAETVAAHAEALGRPLLDLGWFEILGAVTAACITVRLSVLKSGRVPHAADLDRNPVVALIGQRIAASD